MYRVGDELQMESNGILGRPQTAPEVSPPTHQMRYSLRPKDNVLTGSFDSAKLGTRTLTQFPQRVPRSRAETAQLNRELDDMLASVRAPRKRSPCHWRCEFDSRYPNYHTGSHDWRVRQGATEALGKP